MLRLTLGLLACLGCASVSVQTAGSPAEAGASIRTIIIAPLLNRTNNPNADEVVRALVVRALQEEEGLTVVELPPDIIIDPERLDRTRAQEIASKLKVDGIVTGTVFAYGYSDKTPTGGAVPVVRVDLRVVAATTGAIVWVATASGDHPLVMTNDSMPVTELTTKLVSTLTAELKASL